MVAGPSRAPVAPQPIRLIHSEEEGRIPAQVERPHTRPTHLVVEVLTTDLEAPPLTRRIPLGEEVPSTALVGQPHTRQTHLVEEEPSMARMEQRRTRRTPSEVAVPTVVDGGSNRPIAVSRGRV